MPQQVHVRLKNVSDHACLVAIDKALRVAVTQVDPGQIAGSSGMAGQVYESDLTKLEPGATERRTLQVHFRRHGTFTLSVSLSASATSVLGWRPSAQGQLTRVPVTLRDLWRGEVTLEQTVEVAGVSDAAQADSGEWLEYAGLARTDLKDRARRRLVLSSLLLRQQNERGLLAVAAVRANTSSPAERVTCALHMLSAVQQGWGLDSLARLLGDAAISSGGAEEELALEAAGVGQHPSIQSSVFADGISESYALAVPQGMQEKSRELLKRIESKGSTAAVRARATELLAGGR